jgi:hypothetical protein
MSPELKRNIWLEFTGSRVVLMTSVLGLVALAVYLIGGRHLSPLGPIGVGGFVFITIFWGTRNAARSVIGEIRERTWDFQRLSAVAPVSMTIGKLFGSTSYTWYGGVLALLIATAGLSRMMDAGEVVALLGVLVASGLLAHAVALGSALAIARRRRARPLRPPGASAPSIASTSPGCATSPGTARSIARSSSPRSRPLCSHSGRSSAAGARCGSS